MATDTNEAELLIALCGTSEAADRRFAEEAPRTIADLLGRVEELESEADAAREDTKRAEETLSDAFGALGLDDDDVLELAKLGRMWSKLGLLFELARDERERREKEQIARETAERFEHYQEALRHRTVAELRPLFTRLHMRVVGSKARMVSDLANRLAASWMPDTTRKACGV